MSRVNLENSYISLLGFNEQATWGLFFLECGHFCNDDFPTCCLCLDAEPKLYCSVCVRRATES